jgi:hypothetical protein
VKPKSSGTTTTSWVSLPSCDLAITVSMLIATLEITDLRFNLSCYGDFFKQIPARLGSNSAFDASVRALVSAFPFHHTGQLPRDALVHYGEALAELRVVLVQAQEALTPEMLCAIYFVMICQVRLSCQLLIELPTLTIHSQGWIGRMDNHVTSHGEILAHLMSSPTAQTWREGFALDLLVAICVPVVRKHDEWDHKVVQY